MAKAGHAERGVSMSDTANRDGKGFHPMYLWALVYVALTYGYLVIAFMTLPKVDESVNSQAAYDAAAKAQNGVLGSNLPFVFFLIPVALFVINVIIAIASKGTHRRVLLNCTRIIKYLLIPFFIAGGLLCIAFFLLMFTPVVIMVFVSPVVIGVLCVMGYVTLVGTVPLMIAYLSKSVKDGKNGKLFSLLIGILQFFFMADVIGTIICAIKERKNR